MAAITTSYGTAAQAITITLASLAAGSARQSTYISNTTNKYLDVLVQVRIKTGAGSPGGTNVVKVYVYASVDGAVSWPTDVTGSDASIAAPGATTQLILLDTINAPAASTTYTGNAKSVANAFGGAMPAQWGIVVYNDCGIALSSTEGDHKKQYQGLQASVT